MGLFVQLKPTVCKVQAIARVHRMNQSRETHVYRFVINNSIEAVLHKLNTEKFAKMDMANTAQAAADAPLKLSDIAALLSDT
jgi:SNF2 family DNA or RNA helicase